MEPSNRLSLTEVSKSTILILIYSNKNITKYRIDKPEDFSPFSYIWAEANAEQNGVQAYQSMFVLSG